MFENTGVSNKVHEQLKSNLESYNWHGTHFMLFVVIANNFNYNFLKTSCKCELFTVISFENWINSSEYRTPLANSMKQKPNYCDANDDNCKLLWNFLSNLIVKFRMSNVTSLTISHKYFHTIIMMFSCSLKGWYKGFIHARNIINFKWAQAIFAVHVCYFCNNG